MGLSARFCNIIRPPPVKRHVLVNAPYVGKAHRLGKFLFHNYLFCIGGLYAAYAEHCGNVRSILFYYFVEPAVEVRYLLIARTLCKVEPVTRRLVIYAEHHPSERPQILRYGYKMFV